MDYLLSLIPSGLIYRSGPITLSLLNKINRNTSLETVILNKELTDILELPEKYIGTEYYFNHINILRICLTNDLNIISCFFESTKSFIRNDFCYEILYRFCSLDIIQYYRSCVSDSIYLNAINSAVNHLPLLAERHDDNIEIFEYFIKLMTHDQIKLFFNTHYDRILDSAAFHENFNIFKKIHTVFNTLNIDSGIGHIGSLVAKNLLLYKREFIDSVVRHEVLPKETIHYIIINMLRIDNSYKYRNCLAYVVELINEGVIFTTKYDIPLVK